MSDKKDIADDETPAQRAFREANTKKHTVRVKTNQPRGYYAAGKKFDAVEREVEVTEHQVFQLKADPYVMVTGGPELPKGWPNYAALDESPPGSEDNVPDEHLYSHRAEPTLGIAPHGTPLFDEANKAQHGEAPKMGGGRRGVQPQSSGPSHHGEGEKR